jgi:hypothetical protein
MNIFSPFFVTSRLFAHTHCFYFNTVDEVNFLLLLMTAEQYANEHFRGSLSHSLPSTEKVQFHVGRKEAIK